MAATATIRTPGSASELITNEKFPIKGKSLHLSIEIRGEQLLACLLDKHTNQYIAWGLYPISAKENTLVSVLEQDLFSSTSSVSIAFTANSSILVPSMYFKKDALADYLKQQQLDKEGEMPCFDFIKNLDSYNLYTVNAKVLAALRDKFPGANLRHHTSIFIEYVLTENKNAQADKVCVYVFDKHIDVVVLQAGKLILANRFYYENSSDFIYNLLWAFEQLQLNSEKTECVFYGEIEKTSDTFQLASKYIKKVALGTRNELATYSIPLNSLSAHKYRSLFTQYQCI